MKSRKLARLAVLASCACALAGFGSVLGAAPAAAQMSRAPHGIPPLPPCACEPKFTIEKQQEIADSRSGFTTAPVTGAIGQTVNYQIVVTNTGKVTLTFSEFTDPKCDPGTIAGGPGKSHVATGESTTYTCSHVLSEVGAYTNEATVTGTTLVGTSLTQTSNQVVAEVPPRSGFLPEKRQRIGGVGEFTASPLTGAIGQTVEYQIKVKNTGNVALAFGSLQDPQCDAGTIAGGPGGTPVAPGDSTTFTCTHLLTAPGQVINIATITATPSGGSPLTKESNPVEVTVPARSAVATPEKPVEVARGGVKPAVCEASPPSLRGATGPKRRPFTVQISALGIDRITFYIDGRKLKTLKHSQAKGGKFAIRIDPRKFSRGAHVLSVKGASSNPACGTIAQAGSFVRPFTAARRVKFTG
jgi:hypothetical protein